MLRMLSVLALSALMALSLALPASAADYTVRRGDTLGTIAARQGVSGGWRALYDANRSRIANPNVIRVGQTLRLPTTGSSRTTSSSTVSRPSSSPSSAGSYTVRPGDTLGTIASRLGVSGGWRALYDANRTTVANPNILRIGQTLSLPGTSPRRTTSSSTVSRSSTSSSSSASSSTSSAGSRIVAAARSQIGTPYRWGGSSTSGFDCSGLTSWAHARAGVTIPRSSRAQFAAGTRVSNPQPGDLVGFYSPISHVGIYTGNGMMVHASRPGRPVAEVPVFSSGLRGYVRLH